MKAINPKYRDGYYHQIEPFIGDRLIKILVGQRRVGKSYILLQLQNDIKLRFPEAQIIYIDKEDYQFDGMNTYIDLMNYLEELPKNKLKKFLFIDEIQEIDGFEKALRSLQSNGDYDIYCTGSNAKLLSGELATLLAGRYIQFRIYGLSYKEFLLFHNAEDGQDTLLKYIKFGGLPHLINLRDDENVYYEYLRNVFDSIILRDIIARYKVRNVHFLQNLIHYLADNVGSIVSANRISEYLKSQRIALLPKAILEYLSFSESVFFIERAKRFEIGGKRIFEVGDKFYFEDLGMRHALIPFQQKDINKVLENLVFHHLKTCRYQVYVGKMGDKEIDFVAIKDGQTVYLQVCYVMVDDKTHEREFGNLLKIEDNNPKYVISMDQFANTSFKGIYHWSVRKFLMEFE